MPYVGNIEEVKWVYDEEEAREKGSPICIDTPNLEVRVIVLQPGVYPPYHAHHEEMDEGYLIYGGRGLIHNDGDTFEVGKGNVLLNPRGAMHHMKNTGQDELIEFNFRGGRMPSGFLMPPGDPPPNPDPQSVQNPLAPPVPYIKGDVDSLISPFDPESVKQKGFQKAISTEYLECQVASFLPGARPHVHRHQETIDEGTLILEGRMKFIIEGETIEASRGDLVHTPGGALPSKTEWRDA